MSKNKDKSTKQFFVSCEKCDKAFTGQSINSARNNLQYHLDHKVCEKPICNENHEHNIIDKTFSSKEEREEFIKDNLLDQEYSVRHSKGDHRYVMHTCILLDNHKNRLSKKRSRKKEESCPAKFNCYQYEAMIEDELQTKFVLRGCLKHSHHNPNDVGFYRLPRKTKEKIIALLKMGVSIQTIIDKHFSQQDDINRSEIRIPTYSDIHKLKVKYASEFDATIPEVVNLKSILSEKYIRAFSLHDKRLPKQVDLSDMPDEVLKKMVQSDEVVIVIMDEMQKEYLKKFSQSPCIDSTHGTSRSGFLIMTLLVKG